MNFAEILRGMPAMLSRMKEVQAELRETVVEGESGGGMVKARMNGAGELVGLEIEKEAMDPADPEMLADLVMAAVNAARKRVADERMSAVQDAAGMDLSGLGIDLGRFM